VFQQAIAKNKISLHINPMQQFNSPASNLWVNEFNRAVAFNQITTDDAKVLKFPKKVTKGGDVFGFELSTVFLDSRNNIRVAGHNNYYKHGTGDSYIPTNGPGFATNLVDQLEDKEIIAELFYAENSLYALSNLGNLFSCGQNGAGQLGLGNFNATGQLTKIPGISNVTDFSVSTDSSGNFVHCLAVTSSGSLYSWGNNFAGQLGTSVLNNSTSPLLVSGGALSGKTITKARAIGGSSYVIDSNGDLFVCGYNGFGQLGLGNAVFSQTSFVANGEKADEVFGSGVYANSSFALVLRNGILKAAGNNAVGQLGQGNTVPLSSFTTVPGVSEVIDVAASGGAWPSVTALKSDGTVSVWGNNQYGQLGTGPSFESKLSPVTPAGLPANIIQVYQSSSSTFGFMNGFLLTSSGELYVAGYGGSQQGTGRYGTSQPTFVKVEHGKHKITEFRPYTRAVLAKTNLGELLAWGYNVQFQTGTGAGAEVAIPQVVRI